MSNKGSNKKTTKKTAAIKMKYAIAKAVKKDKEPKTTGLPFLHCREDGKMNNFQDFKAKLHMYTSSNYPDIAPIIINNQDIHVADVAQPPANASKFL